MTTESPATACICLIWRFSRKRSRRLKRILRAAPPSNRQSRDIHFLPSPQELFTLVAYGQLILEKAGMDNGDKNQVDPIFVFRVCDFSRCALEIYAKPISMPEQMGLCQKMIRKPHVDPASFTTDWNDHMDVLKGAYEMNR